jgi:hypothetical protein
MQYLDLTFTSMPDKACVNTIRSQKTMENEKKQTKEETRHNLITNIYWKSCTRDDKAAARALYFNREIDAIYGLDDAGLLDDFFNFLESGNIWNKIEKLNSPMIKRVMVSITHFVVLYMLKVIYGFKLIALFAIGTKIPIAVKVVQIQRHESQFVEDLINTAQKNLGRFSKIVEFVADRGFLDGETLWRLHKSKNIRFVVPLKDRMIVKEDARKIARLGGDEVSFKRIEKIVNRGNGCNAYSEKIVTEIYGVSELNTYTAYGPPGHGKDSAKKSFKANPINAIVVTQWENHNYGWEKSKVFVTNMPVVPNPFDAFEAYDDRSIIENSLFRQTKQSLHLQYPINKTQEGMRLHCIFTMSIFALMNAYKQWAEKQYSAIKDGQECGLKRFWKQLKAQNRDKVIVFKDNLFGVLDIAECMLLLNVKVNEFENHDEKQKEVLERYGILTDSN